MNIALAQRVLPLLDLTCLDEDASPDAIAQLCGRARSTAGTVAAVCVYPEYVLSARRALPAQVAVATVVNFPEGGDDPQRVVREVRRALAAGADEIDAVMPWCALLDGREDAVDAVLEAARKACGSARLKLILETGELDSASMIRRAADRALAHGVDFIKTSTGKVPVNATLQAAAVMLHSIRDSGRACGFKAAGGIRTLDQAAAYLDLADELMGPDWVCPARFRFGASGLLGEIEQVLAGTTRAADPLAY